MIPPVQPFAVSLSTCLNLVDPDCLASDDRLCRFYQIWFLILGVSQHDASWRKFAHLFIASCEYFIFLLVVHFVLTVPKLFGTSQINHNRVFAHIPDGHKIVFMKYGCSRSVVVALSLVFICKLF